MATISPNSSKNHNTSLLPKRGRIKAQIFEGLVDTVVSAASKAGELMGKMTKNCCCGGSASASPPPRSYNSDGY